MRAWLRCWLWLFIRVRESSLILSSGKSINGNTRAFSSWNTRQPETCAIHFFGTREHSRTRSAFKTFLKVKINNYSILDQRMYKSKKWEANKLIIQWERKIPTKSNPPQTELVNFNDTPKGNVDFFVLNQERSKTSLLPFDRETNVCF